MSDITKIALTGGPCSGKSTAIIRLKEYYSNQGYTVIVAPESARIVIKNGVSRENMLEFERVVIQHQLDVECEINQRISTMSDEKILVLYDRGIADAFSYLSSEQSQILQKEFNLDLIKIWSRYDAVIFFEIADSKHYISDSVRLESAEDAINAQNLLLDVWVGHPHLRFISSALHIDDKIIDVIGEIDCLLNNVEQEKKYLIEYPNIDLIAKYKPFKAEIEQIYLLSDVGSHRIRKRGKNGSYAYFETVKVRITGDKCFEYENIITEEMYENLKQNADPKKHSIVKDRYCFLYKNQYFELDVFDFWNDKALIELEVKENNTKIELPPEIKVIKDVSKNKKYKNNYLASVNNYENS
jgi:predicted ATPase/CYTH domain-containing protein